MVGYSLSTVAAITAMSGSIEAFTPGNNSGWARSITSTTTTGRSSSLAFSSIRLCGACSQSRHATACKCSSCSRMSHSVSYVHWSYLCVFVLYDNHKSNHHITRFSYLCTSYLIGSLRLSFLRRISFVILHMCIVF
jgi:hypothetical protein